jgi:hypothetical protein
MLLWNGFQAYSVNDLKVTLSARYHLFYWILSDFLKIFPVCTHAAKADEKIQSNIAANDHPHGLATAEDEAEEEKEALAHVRHIASAFARAEPRPFAPVAKDHEGEWALVETKELPRNWTP